MTDKDVKKLSRKDLLEMLIDQSHEIESLREKLSAAEAALKKREIAIEKAGSIAEASLLLNGVFEAAQAACQQYTDNISRLSQSQEASCRQMEEESRAKARYIVEEAEKQRASIEHDTQVRCDEMVAKAEADSQKLWDDASKKLETFAAEHAELQQILSMMSAKK